MTASAIRPQMVFAMSLHLTGGRPLLADGELLCATGNSGKEVIALIVDHDERREVDDIDLPHRFHAELGILVDGDILDAVFGQPGRRAADRAEVESAVLLASIGD